ncbi:hypothetical protein KK083_29230 [Fulvivirgaceae bacterium PWU4]|uniref:Uncharacterized protein n=1 Tax=Chryseosolibacter histidini TaxID=2782349 RepID=A0AAP2DTN4_9BACT|nr:hypothetical protein [Chryseosolibacter histidini]MBT1701012.1 hypothetical protein [Chryseosolibacter histidini]
MLIRSLLLAFIFLLAACRSGEIACPRVKGVKLNRRPENYRMKMNAYASAEEEEKEKFTFPRQTRPVKDAASIEEWDCPKPGTKAQMPRAVKENIRKNRKKFETYYKNRNVPDTLHTSTNRAAGSRR